MNFVLIQLKALWTFLCSPSQTLEKQLQIDPWSTLFFCCFVIFLETGVILFPFLPGDCLLLILGGLLPRAGISVHLGVLLLTLAAFLGAATNYVCGRIVGKKSLPYLRQYEFFEKGFRKAESFSQSHGGKAVVLSRVVGWARTFVPFLSGVCKMDFRIYTLYNLIGAAAWISVFMYIGYFLPPWASMMVGHCIPLGFFLPIVVYFCVR